MPTVTGNITIADLVDGLTGASIVFSNEVHTFTAAADGEITDTELASFTSTPSVYLGTTQATYTNATPTANNTFQVSSTTVSPAGADLTVTTNSTDGTITIADADTVNTGFSDPNTSIDSVSITVTMIIRSNGTNTTYNRVIGLSKAKGGDAKIVRTSQSRQTIEYAYGATNAKPGQNQIVLTSQFINFVATDADAAWTFASGSGSFGAITAAEGTVSTVSDGDADTVDVNNTLSITSAQFQTAAGTNNTVTYRCTKTAGRFDQITIAKLRDAEGGIQIVISSSAATVFKNNQGTTVLTADIYRGSVEILAADINSYAWERDGVTFTPTETQGAGQGIDQKSIVIGAGDVTDGSSHQFTCAVDYN